jgi:hypothetical protein
MLYRVLGVLLVLVLFSCKKDNEPQPSRLNHVGERWIISTVDYNIVDQGFSDPTQWVQNGTAQNAGYFYFNGSEGSYDIVINGKRREDYFGVMIDGASITILQIDQSISPSRFSQDIITFSGEKSSNSMTLSGTITSQKVVSQYVFTGDLVLTKE